ncbi:2314_t:CDS:10, partial [Diversispora eburnea]
MSHTKNEPAILIIGETGSGKSTFRNWLLGFYGYNKDSITTKTSKSYFIKIKDRTYNLIDTPGLFNSSENVESDKSLNKIADAINHCSYGIQTIVLVIKKDHFDPNSITKIKSYLGEQQALDHMIVALTYCDLKQTEDKEKLLKGLNPKLKSFLNSIGNRYVISPDPDLFQKRDQFNRIVSNNMEKAKRFIDSFPAAYTTDVFNKVRQAREECEKSSILQQKHEISQMEIKNLIVKIKEIGQEKDLEEEADLDELSHAKNKYTSVNDLKIRYPAILLLGEIGSGKSIFGNWLLGDDDDPFEAGDNNNTKTCKSRLIKIQDRTYSLIDTPGLFDPSEDVKSEESLNKIADAINHCSYGIQTIVFVMEKDRAFHSEQTMIKIKNFLGEQALNHMIVSLAYCNRIQTENREMLLKCLNPKLESFLDSIGDRYIISPNPDLFTKDDNIVNSNMKIAKEFIYSFPTAYTIETFNKVQALEKFSVQEKDSKNESAGGNNLKIQYPAILILGEAGSGKSTFGNWLLGLHGDDRPFEVGEHNNYITKNSQTQIIKIKDRTYNLIDTPGLFDDKADIENDKSLNDIADAINHCSYGIQTIVFVIKNDPTFHKRKTMTKIKSFLGEQALDNMIVTLTKCNKRQTENQKMFICCLNQRMKSFFSSIEYRYIISPNPDLFTKDDNIVKSNMEKAKEFIHSFPAAYTTETFNKVRRAREQDEIGRKIARKEIEGKCFKLDTKVILEGGNLVPMSGITVNDKVCVDVINGKLKFSEVYLIAHCDYEDETEFLKVEYISP